MYYVENGHEGIVTKEIFDAVQEKLSVPEERVRNHNHIHNLSGKLFCGDCGCFYGPIPIHSTTYNDLVWKCSNRHLKGYPCKTPYLYEEMLYPIFHEIRLFLSFCVNSENGAKFRIVIWAVKAHSVLPPIVAY